MKRLSLIFPVALITFCALTWGQQSNPTDQGALDAVLKKMDAVAANFTTAQANFQWETYQKVIAALLDSGPGVVLICWEHDHIPVLAAALPLAPVTRPSRGAKNTSLPRWKAPTETKRGRP